MSARAAGLGPRPQCVLDGSELSLDASQERPVHLCLERDVTAPVVPTADPFGLEHLVQLDLVLPVHPSVTRVALFRINV